MKELIKNKISGYGRIILDNHIHPCLVYVDKKLGGMEYYNEDGFVVELLLRKV